ncbi:hypothetical protein ABZ557_31795 [Streptomyces sp. NPDC019645]|uniref:hypothetical protein n=1 Tax=Streptomyces sp. NPDC019645 TaxID=3154786 RepID=UPI0033FA8E73
MSADDAAALPYTEFVKDLLTFEDKRRESLEARGAGVISVSGTLVTLLLAFGAFARGKPDAHLPDAAADGLSVAVVAFVAAALLGVLTYAPQRTRIIDPEALARLLPALWEMGRDHSLKKTTAARLEQFAVVQKANNWKARVLAAAVLAQVTGVGALAFAVLALV